MFSAYCDALCSKGYFSRGIPAMLRRDVQMFVAIDSTFATPIDLSELALAQRIGPRLFTHHARLLRWLVARSHIGTLSPIDREWVLLRWWVTPIMAERPQWVVDTLQRYRLELETERDRYVRRHHHRTRAMLRARSALQSIKAGAALLVAAHNTGVPELAALTQHHLDSHLARFRRPPYQLGRFIRYLNEKCRRHAKLEFKFARPQSLTRRGMTKDEFDQVLVRLLQPITRRDLKFSLVTLLCLLYVQQPRSALAFRRDAVRRVEDRWEIRPAKVWLQVPAPMGALLSTWLEPRIEFSRMDATGSSPYLFPGLRSTDHLSFDAAAAWMRSMGLKPRELFASGLTNCNRCDVRFATVLRDAYGVKMSTAVRYLAALNPKGAASVATAIRKSTGNRRPEPEREGL